MKDVQVNENSIDDETALNSNSSKNYEKQESKPSYNLCTNISVTIFIVALMILFYHHIFQPPLHFFKATQVQFSHEKCLFVDDAQIIPKIDLSQYSGFVFESQLKDQMSTLLEDYQIEQIGEVGIKTLLKGCQQYVTEPEKKVSEQIEVKYTTDSKDIEKTSADEKQDGAKERKMEIITIKKRENSQSKDCLFVNAINILSSKSVSSIKLLLNSGLIAEAAFFLDKLDKESKKILENSFAEMSPFESKIPQIDSDYNFLLSGKDKCKNIMWMQNNFILNEDSIPKIKQGLNSVKQYGLIFSPSAKVKEGVKKLKDLRLVDLQTIKSEEIAQYIVAFDKDLLKIITPLNFAFYAKYTLQQMILYPLIALLQRSSQISSFPDNIHEFDEAYIQFKEFKLQPPTPEYNHLCFVSYPSNPHSFDEKNLQSYLNSLRENNNNNISTIVFAPYSSNSMLSEAASFLLSNINRFKRVRLRMRANNTVSSLSVYESVYTYCPPKSMIVASRHNVKFENNFTTTLNNRIQERHHYYATTFKYEDKEISLARIFTLRVIRSDLSIYENYFQFMQIFRSDLFKMLYMWYLKCEEIDFYQSESSYTIPLLQMIRLNFKNIPQIGYRVTRREFTTMERNQSKNIGLYLERPQIKAISPFQYNALENEAFRRNAPEKMPRKIHQIWIGGEEISQIRWKLQDTVAEANPGFEMILWKDSDLTVQKFPFMYGLIRRSQQYQKTSKRSYNAPIASLMRYELLYHHGGIYMDFKTEGRKSFMPFLKYENFFTDCDYDTFKDVRFVGNGIMGASIHNPHLYKLITELINQQDIDYEATDFPRMTGGYVLRKSFTEEEIFKKVGFGFHLLSPHPSHKPILCATETDFRKDQKVYDVQDTKGKRFRIGIPCTIYPETYSIFYKPLAGSWKV